MKKYLKIGALISGSLLVGTLILSPLSTFAKDNGKGNSDNENRSNKNEQVKNDQAKVQVKVEKDTDKNNKKDNKSCVRAFGHLIAPGWIKHNTTVSIGDECNLPFGIGKKYDKEHSTSTPGTGTTTDTTAPILGALSINPRITDAVIRWFTNEKSDTTVFYSLNTPVDLSASTTKVVLQTSLNRDHVVVLSPLSASTTYYMVIRSRDAAGNTATSAQTSFTTKNYPVVATTTDTSAPVITNAVAIIGSTTVQLSWKTNENATTKAYYSTSTPVNVAASTTAFVENTSLVSAHAITVTGLATSTQYYMVYESKDSTGNTSRTNEFSFTTTAGI
ncbi:MAG: hypothetical protein PHG25_00105 [Candidatus Pacebacteria bacterium]|nr:hypothetical protein [Candidatus Paceibacterota bacterium]